MGDDLNNICKICGGDKTLGELASRLGYRPDVAFAKLAEAEQELSAWRERFPDYRYANVVDGIIED